MRLPWTIKLGLSLPGKLTDIYTINQTDDWQNIGCKVKQIFPAVFDERQSQVNNFTASLRLTTDAKPVRWNSRRIPLPMVGSVKKELDRLIQANILSPVNSNEDIPQEWATPIVVVRKKSGEIRIFADFRVTLNKYLVKDAFQMPHIEQIINQEICRPLYQLISKVKWKWTIEHTMCFRDIKDALRHPVSLTPYRLDKPLILTCDASNAGLGDALCHDINSNIKPIFLTCRVLSTAEEKYYVIDHEALAIFFAVRRFHDYVYGRRFEIWTDHKPLVAMLGDSRDLRTMTNTRMIRWALHLSGYNYTIKYIEGKDNVYADILSRSPTAARNVTVKQNYDLDNEDNILVVQEEKLDQIELSSHELQKASHTDTQLRRITRYVRFGWPSKVQDIDKTFGFRRNELSYENGILMFQQRIVIPEALHRCVLRILHEGPPREAAMKTYARYYVWWPRLDNDIHNYVASCYDCQIMRPAARELPLYNWDVPCKPWHRIYLDFVGTINGNMFLILVDARTKWPEVWKAKTWTSITLCWALQSAWARWGIPAQIVTDNGPQFISSEFRNFCQRNSIKHIRTSPYHPQANGLAERFIQTLKSRVLKRNFDSQALLTFLQSYRNSVHATTSKTPAELMIGRRLPTVFENVKPTMERRIQEQHERWSQRRSASAQTRFFTIGDLVWFYDKRKNIWKETVIINRNGLASYEIECEGVHRRTHGNELRWRIHNKDELQDSEVVSDTEDQTIEIQQAKKDGIGKQCESGNHQCRTNDDPYTSTYPNESRIKREHEKVDQDNEANQHEKVDQDKEANQHTPDSEQINYSQNCDEVTETDDVKKAIRRIQYASSLVRKKKMLHTALCTSSQ
ncbi:hypothetical protein GJ496_007830 [Pomphorhynchus laevis]|nr:hypothetical protein GJ496_007830 [Pomphorhynchus laevis]